MSLYRKIIRKWAIWKADLLYAHCFKLFGDTAGGVHWRDEQEQQLRFQILCEPMKEYLYENPKVSITDLGCGYGALFDYLQNRGFVGQYYGYERNSKMIQYAKQQFPYKNAHFIHRSAIQIPTDFTVISGTLNLKMQAPTEIWWEEVQDILESTWMKTRWMMAFNYLAIPSKRTMMNRLFYCNSKDMNEFCSTLSQHVCIQEIPPLLDTQVHVWRNEFQKIKSAEHSKNDS